MRIPSGKVDCALYFVAVDVTDFVTRETGLSSFTVYRSRNGAAEAAYTTPTITEVDATNMPGVYTLLVDEDTTIEVTSDSEEYCVHITHAGMAPVTRTVELYRSQAASTPPTAIEIADALLDRDMAAGTDSGSTTVRTPRQALRFLRNKWSIAGSTLTVTKENDATASWTAAISQTAGADPITGSDPAGP
jgi:hypothetical protein